MEKYIYIKQVSNGTDDIENLYKFTELPSDITIGEPGEDGYTYFIISKEEYIGYKLKSAYNNDKFYALVIAKFNSLDNKVFATTRFADSTLVDLLNQGQDKQVWAEFMETISDHMANAWIDAEDKIVDTNHLIVFEKAYLALEDDDFKDWLTSMLQAAQHANDKNWLKQIGDYTFGAIQLSAIDVDKNKFL